ncbi:helix-turn-helix transcriptional regulator (plasmid) [Cytobacillus spongiae]|uniref:helix-turn-helix transcriptional regulator n=1 Tax=Cytobacillus spongiae TaxID=2901381 RepID=UPI001F2B91E4|nr:helix-turn-helix transcriptional regulator [Cytobacillus spongiae]UII58133.1 helix-turn-helix transcriptional regulator [Cytobacillus spongiae]
MFTNRISVLAREKGLKHGYLAKQCGVAAQTFSNWTTNKTQPPLDKAFILADLLGVKVDDLHERSN